VIEAVVRQLMQTCKDCWIAAQTVHEWMKLQDNDLEMPQESIKRIGRRGRVVEAEGY